MAGWERATMSSGASSASTTSRSRGRRWAPGALKLWPGFPSHQEGVPMARSPLLNRLQTLFQDFDDSERSGVPVAEIRRQRREGLTRRDFLKVAGVAAGAALVPGAALAATTKRSGSQGRSAIVGGGIAGLNAALTLADAGLAYTGYEASNRVGGRMHSDTTSWLNGQTSEHCGELIDSGH